MPKRALTKHRKEHKGANLLKYTRISASRGHKEYKGANLLNKYKNFNSKGSS